MSDVTQMDETAPDADEVGDGGANIDQQPDGGAMEDADVEAPTSEGKQADGDFPIMT